MEALVELVNRIQPESLKEWFTFRRWPVPDSIDWLNFMSLPDVLTVLASSLSEYEQALMAEDVRRIDHMAGTNGIHALYQVFEQASELKNLSDDYECSLWVFLNNQSAFASAETLLAFNNSRGKPRGWSRFDTHPGISKITIEAGIPAFEAALVTTVEGGQYCKATVFAHPHTDITQINLFHQKKPETAIAFDDQGNMLRTNWQPVSQFIILYDWGLGEIEIAGGIQKDRLDISKLVGLLLLDNAPITDSTRTHNNLSCFSEELSLAKIDGVISTETTAVNIVLPDVGMIEDRRLPSTAMTFHESIHTLYKDENPFTKNHVVRSGTLKCLYRDPNNPTLIHEVIITFSRSNCTFKKCPNNATKELFKNIYLPHWGIALPKEES